MHHMRDDQTWPRVRWAKTHILKGFVPMGALGSKQAQSMHDRRPCGSRCTCAAAFLDPSQGLHVCGALKGTPCPIASYAEFNFEDSYHVLLALDDYDLL